MCQGHLRHNSGCERAGNPRYDLYCTHCFKNLFPNDPRTALIRTKSKETTWVNYILTSLPDLDWLWDQTFQVDFWGGCCATRRRIDLRVLVEHPDKGLFWLCIEIDEFQHKSYAADYEEARYNDLFVDFSGRYLFLRINPDSFVRQGVRLNPPFEERCDTVLAEIERALAEGPQSDDLVEVRHYYYDE